MRITIPQRDMISIPNTLKIELKKEEEAVMVVKF